MNLFSAISVSASGMQAQRERAQLLVQNLANAETTRTEGGGPYRRQDVVFSPAPAEGDFRTEFAAHLTGGPTGVRVSEVVTDTREPEKRYLPGHPDAGKDGYVAFPRLNPAEDMVDLLSTTRSYQANLAAISAVKDMIVRSLELFR